MHSVWERRTSFEQRRVDLVANDHNRQALHTASGMHSNGRFRLLGVPDRERACTQRSVGVS